MLDAHFVCGDGRCNENIALSTIHQVFHSEHDRLVDYIKNVLTDDTSATGAAAYPMATPAAEPLRLERRALVPGSTFRDRDGIPAPGLRGVRPQGSAGDPSVPRVQLRRQLGHPGRVRPRSIASVTRCSTTTSPAPTYGGGKRQLSAAADGVLESSGVLQRRPAGTLTPERAAGSIVMGSSDQVGNELDEFVTETLRNNLLGLPLDLPVLNMTRARDVGIPPLNEVRRQLFARTNDGQLQPYTSWSDFGAPEAPGVADQLRCGIRDAPQHHQRDHLGRQAPRHVPSSTRGADVHL